MSPTWIARSGGTPRRPRGNREDAGVWLLHPHHVRVDHRGRCGRSPARSRSASDATRRRSTRLPARSRGRRARRAPSLRPARAGTRDSSPGGRGQRVEHGPGLAGQGARGREDGLEIGPPQPRLPAVPHRGPRAAGTKRTVDRRLAATRHPDGGGVVRYPWAASSRTTRSQSRCRSVLRRRGEWRGSPGYRARTHAPQLLTSTPALDAAMTRSGWNVTGGQA